MENYQGITEGLIEDVSVHVANNVDTAIAFICVSEPAAQLLRRGLNEARIEWELNNDEVFFQITFGEGRDIQVKSNRITNERRLLNLLTNKPTFYLAYSAYRNESNVLVKVSEIETYVLVSPSSILSHC